MTLDDTPVKEAEAVIRTYLRCASWQILDQTNDPKTLARIIQTANAERSILHLLANRQPQLVSWTISQRNGDSRIEVQFGMRPAVKKTLNEFTPILMSATGFTALLGVLGLGPMFLLSACLLLGSALFLMWIADPSGYSRFMRQFYSHVSESTGRKMRPLESGVYPPSYEYFLAYLVFAVVFIGILLTLSPEGLPVRLFGGLLFVLLAGGLLFTLFYIPGYPARSHAKQTYTLCKCHALRLGRDHQA